MLKVYFNCNSISVIKDVIVYKAVVHGSPQQNCKGAVKFFNCVLIKSDKVNLSVVYTECVKCSIGMFIFCVKAPLYFFAASTFLLNSFLS